MFSIRLFYQYENDRMCSLLSILIETRQCLVIKHVTISKRIVSVSVCLSMLNYSAETQILIYVI